MCGIVGYLGPRDAAEILLAGLDRLEYRGYDSAGVAVHDGAKLQVRKVAGRVLRLRELLGREPVSGTCGVAHTRWATHGAPTDANAHPHLDCAGAIAVVHNGIIENADLLRARLESEGHRFVTETDTEVLAHLIEGAEGVELEERVRSALAAVEGTYGLVVSCAAEPGKLVAARRGSPVLLGIGQGEFFVASDPTPLLAHTRSMVSLDDGDMAVLTRTGYRILDDAAHPQSRTVDDITWDPGTAELGGYPDFMLKEIWEQPETLRQTLRGRVSVSDGTARLNGLNLSPEECAHLERIVIV
ncbi:MAG: glutamine--fructose-6-phosphate aminotransferase, partial [Gemmatimonadales bacterium]